VLCSARAVCCYIDCVILRRFSPHFGVRLAISRSKGGANVNARSYNAIEINVSGHRRKLLEID